MRSGRGRKWISDSHCTLCLLFQSIKGSWVGVRMETDLTGLVIRVAEESGHQSLSAFMEEKFNLSWRQLHFTGGR